MVKACLSSTELRDEIIEEKRGFTINAKEKKKGKKKQYRV